MIRRTGATVLREMIEGIRGVWVGGQKPWGKQMKNFQREKKSWFCFRGFEQGETKLMVKVTGKLISPVSQNPKELG